jgi:hypothetical protein
MVNNTAMHATTLSTREPRLKASTLADKQTMTRTAPANRTAGVAGSERKVPTPD